MNIDDLILLREIATQGGTKWCTVGHIDLRRYQRLAGAGLLTPYATTISDVLYELTPTGRAAATNR